MKEYLTAAVAFNQVNLLRDVHKGAIVLVEDSASGNYLKSTVLDPYSVHVIVTHGKPKLYDALFALRDDPKVLGIADADYERIMGASPPDKCIWFDFRDLEVALICTAAFDRIIAEYNDRASAAALRAEILEAAAVVGAWRLAVAKGVHLLSFQELVVADHLNILGRTVSEASVRSWMEDRLGTTGFPEHLGGLDVRDVARGHDATAVAAALLDHDFGAGLPPGEFERLLRLASRFDDLFGGRFLASLQQWEETHDESLLCA